MVAKAIRLLAIMASAIIGLLFIAQCMVSSVSFTHLHDTDAGMEDLANTVLAFGTKRGSWGDRGELQKLAEATIKTNGLTPVDKKAGSAKVRIGNKNSNVASNEILVKVDPALDSVSPKDPLPSGKQMCVEVEVPVTYFVPGSGLAGGNPIKHSKMTSVRHCAAVSVYRKSYDLEDKDGNYDSYNTNFK